MGNSVTELKRRARLMTDGYQCPKCGGEATLTWGHVTVIHQRDCTVYARIPSAIYLCSYPDHPRCELADRQ